MIWSWILLCAVVVAIVALVLRSPAPPDRRRRTDGDKRCDGCGLWCSHTSIAKGWGERETPHEMRLCPACDPPGWTPDEAGAALYFDLRGAPCAWRPRPPPGEPQSEGRVLPP